MDSCRCIAVLEASSGMDVEAAQAAWRADDPFAGLASEGVNRYVRGFAVGTDEPALTRRGRIGVAHLWMESEAAALALNRRLRAGEFHKDHSVLGSARIIALPVAKRYHLGEADDYARTPLRAVFLVKRRDDLTPQQFHRHWREVHGPMLIGQDGITSYAQQHRLYDSYDEGGPNFDGVAELSFPDEAGFRAFATCEPHAANQNADLPNLFDLTAGKRFFSREEAIF